MSAPIIGIDLGTTNTVVAVFEEGGPRVLVDEAGESLLPSVVAIDDDGYLLVGRPAKERLLRGAPGAVARFKGSMGSPKRWTLGGRSLDATALSALVLKEIRAVAEQSLGTSVRKAVISVPAWFGEAQRRATVEAAWIAGIEPQRLVNEPTAAALAYGLTADVDASVAVLDLGGGTFDVTVLELIEGVADVRSSSGDTQLGGEDVTDAIAGWALSEARLADTDAGRLTMRARAEAAKRRLSSEAEAELKVGERSLRLSRERLDELTRPLAERVRRCIRDALFQARLRPEGVEDVLLVGGATRMPWVSAVAQEIFGRAPRPAGDVDHLVALGAAVQAGLTSRHKALRERLVTDVLTHSIGVAVARHIGNQLVAGRFEPMLPRGTTLPATRKAPFQTIHPRQTEVLIEVFEGESRETLHNQLLGTLRVDGLEPHEDDEVEHFETRFTHDASGLLEVDVTVLSTGRTAHATFERGGTAYSSAEREAIAAQLATLKVHPRELLPNRWLFERATRVVEMLSGSDRKGLDELLTWFEGTLEEGEPEAQKLARERLRGAVDAVIARYGLELED